MRTVEQIAQEVWVDCFGGEFAVDDAVVDYAIRVARAAIDDRLPAARWSGSIGLTGMVETP